MRRLSNFALIAAGICAGAASANELDVRPMRYTCERGVAVPVTYINAAEGSAVVLNVDGQQITLLNVMAGSGARYEWPSDGSGYVWWSKGPTATLYWKNGEDKTETPILSDCTEN